MYKITVEFRFKLDIEHYKDFIYRYVAGRKFNAFVYGVHGDFLRFPSHPELAAPNSISPAELKEIVDFGKKHFVEMIPGFNSPAHLPAIGKAHPELQAYPGAKSYAATYMLDINNPNTFKLISELIADLILIYNSKFFYIGGDEVWWWKYEESKNDSPETVEKMKYSYLSYISMEKDFLAKKGIQSIMAADMIIPHNHGQDGRYNVGDIIDKAPKDIILLDWMGNNEEYLWEKGFKKLLRCNILGYNPEYTKYLGGVYAEWSFSYCSAFQYNFPDITIARAIFSSYLISGEYFWNIQPEKKDADGYDLNISAKYMKEFGSELMRIINFKPNPAASEKYRPVDISPYCNTELADEQAGDKKGWMDLGPYYDMRNFKTGSVNIGGVPMLVIDGKNKACISLKDTVEARGIKIADKYSSLLFLHTAHINDLVNFKKEAAKIAALAKTRPDEHMKGILVGKYQVNYEDGKKETIDLRYGYNITKWQWGSSPDQTILQYIYDSRWVTRAQTRDAGRQDKDFFDIAVVQYEWVNPRPDITISSMDFISEKTQVIPVLLAVTGRE